MKLSHLALLSRLTALCKSLTFIGALVFASGTALQSQVATVGVTERVVEKRAGAGNWADTKKGTPLTQGDGLRTGKRSKVDTLFRDGSLVRLGQLSSLEIQSGNTETTRVKLQDGRVLFVKKPGSGGTNRVLTGTGAAEIKGSVASVQAFKNGSAEYINYSGNVSVVGIIVVNGQEVETQRVVLPPGRSVKTLPGGLLSPITLAPPFSSQIELIDAPIDNPFPGSKVQVIERAQPGISAIDRVLPGGNVEIIENTRSNPFIARAPLPDGQPPFGGPFPPPTNRQFIYGRSPAKLNSSVALPELKGRSMAAQITAPVLIAQLNPPAPAPKVDAGQAAQNLGQSVAGAAIVPVEDFRPTYKHLEDVNWRLGKISGLDYRATGFIGNNSLLAGIGQLHAYTKEGNWSADLVINPQDIRFDTPTRRIRRNTIVVSDANLAYAAKAGSLIVGRQRFLAGPVRASFFGSMTRANGREIMDAVRLIPRINKNYSAEISYLYDAYPRELLPGVRGNQQGFLGRVYTLQRFGNFGLNVLRYKDSPVPDRTGVTLDFSVPVLTKKLEVYGEVGTDPFKRKLRTFGFTSPLLFQKTGFDLYIERAKLNNSASAAGVGDEWAVRLYRPLSDNVDFVGAYNRYNGGNSTFLIGVAVGGQAIFPSR